MSLLKKLFVTLGAAVAMASANAAPIAVSTTFTPAGGTTLITPESPYDFTLNIGSVFNFATDTLDSGSVVFSLTDTGTHQETIRFVFAFSLGNVNGVQVYTVNGNNNVQNGNGNVTTETVLLNSGSISDLAADGLLSIRLGAINGDYNFVNATFNGLVSAPAASAGEVPEPFTLALLGVALAGAAVARRRK